MQKKTNELLELLKKLKKQNPHLSPAEIRKLAKKQLKAERKKLVEQLKNMKKQKKQQFKDDVENDINIE